jgi:two-component system, NarL family, nitrate/nitrite response regulator NarL
MGRLPIRVLLADDHPMYLEALAGAISAAGDLLLADTVADGRAALDAIRALHPDVALIDVRAPVLSGPVVAQQVADEGLPTRVVLLGSHTPRTRAQDGWGFVAKDAPMVEIHRAIRRVASGDRL